MGDKIKLFTCGVIPIAEKLLEVFSVRTYSSLPEVDRKAIELLDGIKKTSGDVVAFYKLYETWAKERRHCIKELRELAENIDWHHRNSNVVQLPTSAVGIAGGVLSIVGLALIPVTFGVSLGLTIAGGVVGGVAAATGVGNAIADIGITINRSKKAKTYIEEHQTTTESMKTIVASLLQNSNKLSTIATSEVMEVIDQAMVRNAGQLTKVTAIGAKNSVSTGYTLIKTIPSAIKALTLLRRSTGVAVATGTTSIRAVESTAADVASGTAAGTAKVVSAGGEVLRGFGFAFSAIGIAVDIFTIGFTVYDLAKGSQTSAAKKLREVADHLEEELKQVKDIHSKLNNVIE